MEAGDTNVTQARVRLTTKSSDIELPNDIGSILVSTDFRRYQLSTLVNKLLDTSQPIPLEFLINGQFLRTSLDEFLTRNGISAETTLQIEYVRALIPPSEVSTYEHDDWVSSVDVLSSTSPARQWSGDAFDPSASRIVSGCYDNLLRVWNLSSEVVATGKGHTSFIKAVKFMTSKQIVSTASDRTVRVWDYKGSNLTPTLELRGHKMSARGLAVHAPSSRILTGSQDGAVGIWTTKKADAPAPPEGSQPNSSKRRKLSGDTKPVPQRGPLRLLKGHQDEAAAVCFDENDPTVGYSASWDHSMKTWDLITGDCVDTRTTAQSLFSICHLPARTLIATGTVARHITLIDPRASATTVSAMTLRGHLNTVVSLARDPDSDFRLLSGSHDGSCRIWDIRSVRLEAGADRVGESVCVIERTVGKGSAKTVAGEGIKVFGVCWDDEVGIVSGSEDKRVQINRSPE